MDPELPPPRPIPRLRFFVALVIVAVFSALFASAFRAATTFLFQRVMHAPDVLVLFQRLPFWARVLLPTFGGAIAGLLAERATREAGGHSVGDVMEAVALGGVRPSIGAASLKALGSWAAIVTGMSIGREGPLVQFGGALGSKVGTTLRISELRTRALIAAGIGAGFAAAYNTPLAAVLFVVEVFTGVAALSIVLPTLIAVAIATALTRFFVGDGPIYGQHTFAMHAPWELGVHFVLGALGGLAGFAFMRLLSAGETVFSRVKARPLRAAIGGAIVGSIACALPTVTGNGYEAIALILGGGIPLGALVLLVIAKPVATSISVGSGSPGGVFTPRCSSAPRWARCSRPRSCGSCPPSAPRAATRS